MNIFYLNLTIDWIVNLYSEKSRSIRLRLLRFVNFNVLYDAPHICVAAHSDPTTSVYRQNFVQKSRDLYKKLYVPKHEVLSLFNISSHVVDHIKKNRQVFYVF